MNTLVLHDSSKALISQFLKRRAGMGCQALDFRSQSNYVFKMSRMHACLQNMQHIENPSPRGKPRRPGSAVLLEENDPACFSNLQK